MSAETLILSLARSGVFLSLSDSGEIRAKGNAASIKARLPDIRAHKAEILAALQARNSDWLVTLPDRDPVEVYFLRDVSIELVREKYPDAVSVAPLPDPAGDIQRPSTSLTAGQEKAIWGWCSSIGEADPELIASVLAQCEQDAAARAYFLGRAQEPPKIDREYVEERAGVREYDGGLSREEAERMAVLDAGGTLCMACAHLRQPGHSDGFCHEDARPDLPLAYGESHPLRKLPDDLGASCPAFKLVAWRCQ
jgi:hypothetical protein